MLTDYCSENLKGKDHFNFRLVGTIILKLLLEENGVMDWNMAQDWFQRLSLMNKLIAFMCHASEGVPNQMTTNYLKKDPPTLCKPSLCSYILLHVMFPWWHDLCTLLHFHSNVTLLLHNNAFVAFP
jgi:hypothetical protein